MPNSRETAASQHPSRAPFLRPTPTVTEPDPVERSFSPLSRLPAWLRDVIVVLLVLGPSLAPHSLGGGALSSVAAALLVLVSAGSVLLRRRAPLVGASAAVVACVLGLAVGGPIVSYLIAVLIGVFAVARWQPRRTSLLFSGAAVLLLAAATVAFLETPWNDARAMLQLAAFVGFATAAGDANKSHAAYIRGITERARRAEETKESEALRRVAEERLRIARDLHDLLAHQIAVINLHSSVASQALPDRPADAEKSLATIREAARTVLGEIGSLLNVLRAPDAAADQTTAPVAGLADLEPLLLDFERSGLLVEHRLVGTPRPLPGAVDSVAFRVVQEALTNAQKHGADRSCLLHLDYQPGGIEITVTNTVASPGRAATADAASAADTVGHGLLGARERVGAVNGTLTALRGPGPVFRFTAWLPTDLPADSRPNGDS